MRARIASVLVCFSLLASACSGGSGLSELPAISSEPQFQMIDLAITDDGALAAVLASGTGDADTLLRVYQLGTGKLLWRDEFGDGRILFDGRFYFTPDGAQLAAAYSDAERDRDVFVRYYDARTGEPAVEHALDDGEDLLAADSDRLVTSVYSVLRFRDAATGEITATLDFPGELQFARFIDGGRTLLVGHNLSGGRGIVLHRFDPENLALDDAAVTISPLSGTQARSIWVSADGGLIAGTVLNGQETWAADARTGAQTYGLPAAAVANERVSSPRFTTGSGILADGRYLYATNAGYVTAIKLADQSWTTLLDLNDTSPTAFAVSADGRTIAVLDDERLRSWRLPQ